MHRIDTSTAQKDKFGAGKNGFTDGNPQTGIPATDLNASMFDAIQEEICTVIESAGLTLNSSQNNQLFTAIKQIVNGSDSGSVETVNDIGPDDTGNIQLAASDIGALPTTGGTLDGNLIVEGTTTMQQAVNMNKGVSVLGTTSLVGDVNLGGAGYAINANTDINISEGHAVYSQSPILLEIENPGDPADGSFVTTPVLKFRLNGRGALDDPAGAFAQLYYEEHVGTDNALCLGIDGFGGNVTLRFVNSSTDDATQSELQFPGQLIPGNYSNFDARYYGPNNPQPVSVVTGDAPGATAMLYDSTAPHNFGDRVDGSVLYPSGADGTHATVPVSGTWVCQGQTDTENEAHRTTNWTRLV